MMIYLWTSDEDRRGIDELDELCSINIIGRYIDSGCLYDEIIAKLSLILNYIVTNNVSVLLIIS